MGSAKCSYWQDYLIKSKRLILYCNFWKNNVLNDKLKLKKKINDKKT